MAKVLIVEDEEDLRDLISTVLQEAGHATIVTIDGEAGMRAFAAGRPDLVITDVIMPEADGIETIRRIRTLDPAARIIAMSGGALIGNDYYLRMAKPLGAMAVLAKPFDIDDLVHLVDACLRQPTPVPPNN